MSGVTDLFFRRLAVQLGAPMVVSEMVASREFINGTSEARIRAEGARVRPHVLQIAGCEPAAMAEAARLGEASGADIIDINMGCPAKKVTAGWAGAALLQDRDLAMAIVTAVVAAVRVPVTLKMRLGWSAAVEVAPEFAREAQNRGVAMVTVHGRTRDQFYKGQADWRAVARTREAINIPLVVNGDVCCAETAASSLAQSRADAVMIGRAAVGRPWLVAEIANTLNGQPARRPCAAARAEAAAFHLDGLLGLLGCEKGLRHARKHLAAYAECATLDGFPFARSIRQELVTTDEPQRAFQLLSALFSESSTRVIAA
jgi:hypothetical protein